MVLTRQTPRYGFPSLPVPVAVAVAVAVIAAAVVRQLDHELHRQHSAWKYLKTSIFLFFLLVPFHNHASRSTYIKERVSSDDLAALLEGTAALNAEYNSEIITEFPFNGIGILDKVGRVGKARNVHRYLGRHETESTKLQI